MYILRLKNWNPTSKNPASAPDIYIHVNIIKKCTRIYMHLFIYKLRTNLTFSILLNILVMINNLYDDFKKLWPLYHMTIKRKMKTATITPAPFWNLQDETNRMA